MNKNILMVSLAAGLFAASAASALAAETGTINFAGRIIADTCEISLNGTSGDSLMVTFDDTYPSDYPMIGTFKTSKDFKIELAKCDLNVAKLNIRFSGENFGGDQSNILKMATGSADTTNIGITIVDNDFGQKHIKFDNSIPDSSTDRANSAGNIAVFNYTASVVQVADEPPTLGAYTSSVAFEVFYR